MFKKIALYICLLSLSASAQTINISGSLVDTNSNTALSNAVVMALKFSDSTLIAFTRSDKNGIIKLPNLPLDTYLVIISHPNFGDKQLFILGNEKNREIKLNKIILPSKTISLQEVVVIGYSDPVYRKGDTLIYTADSFKVKTNAVVEDLLKKLPGVRVDAQGKIYVEGKKVDKLLVDGDEFFGSNQTIATKNLDAKAIESIQVYDKKNEATSVNDAHATEKVMNLKLKEGAKKGYFGRATGGGDFSKFYEGELLANHFKNKLKLSVFALTSNTPRSNFNWEDKSQYGLNDWTDESQFEEQSGKGLPKTFKTGMFYSDKPWKDANLNLNYTYNPTSLNSKTNSSSKYFFADTSYRKIDSIINRQSNDSHVANLIFKQDIDSAIKIYATSNIKYNTGNNQDDKTTEYYTDENILTRRSTINNSSQSQNASAINSIYFTRKFKNKDKVLHINYNNKITQNDIKSILQSQNSYPLILTKPNDSINQQKTNAYSYQNHDATIDYTQPLSKKFSLNFWYQYSHSNSVQNKRTLNFSNGDYTIENALFTNNFQTRRNSNEVGTSISYKVKRHNMDVGLSEKQQESVNTNKVTGDITTQKAKDIILPYITYSYQNENKYFYLRYITESKLPSINQLQPIPDNSNPNQISLGNPSLSSSYKHSVYAYFSSYRPISAKYLGFNAHYDFINNDFSNSTTYDSIGRAYTKIVNVNGNYSAGSDLDLNLPMFSKLINLSPSISLNRTKNTNYINEKENITTNKSIAPKLNISLTLDKFEFSLGGSYAYNTPSSSLNPASNTPYVSTNYNSDIVFKFPHKIQINSGANYNKSSRRAQGYNIDYLIWNASFSKTFFKKENFILTFSVTDLLNQNINVSRIVTDNVIMDAKTNTISRYFLVKATFKFNSNKATINETTP